MSTEVINAIEITGRKEAMEPFGIRLPKIDAQAVRRVARANRCTAADVIRTFVRDGVVKHNLAVGA